MCGPTRRPCSGCSTASTPAADRRPPAPEAQSSADPVAPVAPAPPRIDERVVVVLQRVGEALVDARRSEALVLPQRDDEQLAAGAVVAADEDHVAVDEVAHVDRAA